VVTKSFLSRDRCFCLFFLFLSVIGGQELFLLFGSGVGSGVAEGRECFFRTPEKMRGGRFVHCVIAVCLLIVFVAI